MVRLGIDMTETENIKVSNLASITCAAAAMRNVLAGDKDEYGINKEELIDITKRIAEAQIKLSKQIKTEGE